MTNHDPAATVAAYEAMRESILQAVYKIEQDIERADAYFADHVKPLILEGGHDGPILFGSPVTGLIEPGDNIWGGAWFAATSYAEKYSGGYHTGYDLNLPGFADAGKPVFAMADGEIVFSGQVAGWQGLVVVIEHPLVDGKPVWTRYAHIKNTLGLGNVKRGQQIGVIADYTPLNKPEGDHLHVDAARIDLGAKPGDWPGNDLARVIRDYIDLKKLLTGSTA